MERWDGDRQHRRVGAWHAITELGLDAVAVHAYGQHGDAAFGIVRCDLVATRKLELERALWGRSARSAAIGAVDVALAARDVLVQASGRVELLGAAAN